MKIVIFCQVFYPDPSSVGQHMFDLAFELAKRNDVTVITSRNNSNNFNETYLKMKHTKILESKGIKIFLEIKGIFLDF